MELTTSQNEVREHYAEVACQAASGCSVDRGCGKPLTRAMLQPGEVVLDLGCGGGSEVLEAAAQVGISGFVYGLDMTEEMLAFARQRATDEGVKNVDFVYGMIEDAPLGDAAVDVIISNCVLNLCDDKQQALAGAYKMLKNKGRLCVADIVLLDESVPAAMQRPLAAVLGCTNGVLSIKAYIETLESVGFVDADVAVYQVYPAGRILTRAEERKDSSALAQLESLEARQLIDRAFGAAFVTARK